MALDELRQLFHQIDEQQLESADWRFIRALVWNEVASAASSTSPTRSSRESIAMQRSSLICVRWKAEKCSDLDHLRALGSATREAHAPRAASSSVRHACRNSSYRLEFDDETLIHEQLEAALSDRESFVVHTDGDLALERYLAQMQRASS